MDRDWERSVVLSEPHAFALHLAEKQHIARARLPLAIVASAGNQKAFVADGLGRRGVSDCSGSGPCFRGWSHYFGEAISLLSGGADYRS